MENVADRLRASAARLPGKTALLSGGSEVSYGELDGRAQRAAAAFQGLGLAPGDRVALMVGNVTDFAVTLYGALRAGLVVVPLNVGYTAPEVDHIVRDSGARAAVAADEALGAVPREDSPLEHVMGAGAWADLVAAAGEPKPVELEEGALALLQYTSGTTGRPRGAMLSHAALLANQDQMRGTRLAVEERDVVLCALPLFHIYALNVALLFPLARGATVLLVERFTPDGTLDDVARHRVSVIVGAPPMYVAWLGTQRRDHDLASVRIALSGAAPLPVDVFEDVRSAFGLAIWEGYGLTETAPLLTTTGMDTRPTPGTVGKPVPGVELRILDDTGAVAPEGDPGEVIARGPNLFSGYWQAPEATAAVVDADGWFHTGDVGYLDRGNLYLVDRKRDLVIVNGFNVYPSEVEDVLGLHPGVAEAAVVGVPEPQTGEAVKAFVVPIPGAEPTAEELIEHCLRHLARYKCPTEVAFLATLPHLPSGKLKRRELREL